MPLRGGFNPQRFFGCVPRAKLVLIEARVSRINNADGMYDNVKQLLTVDVEVVVVIT